MFIRQGWRAMLSRRRPIMASGASSPTLATLLSVRILEQAGLASPVQWTGWFQMRGGVAPRRGLHAQDGVGPTSGGRRVGPMSCKCLSQDPMDVGPTPEPGTRQASQGKGMDYVMD